MKRNLSLSLILLVLLVSGARAITPTPCSVEFGCPDPVGVNRVMPNGTRVSWALIDGAVSGMQSYGGRTIFHRLSGDTVEFSTVTKTATGSLLTTTLGFRVSTDRKRVALLVNRTYLNYIDSANQAQTMTALNMLTKDSRITPIRMVPSVLPAGGVGWWQDFQGAMDAGASSACNAATAKVLYYAAALTAAALGPWAALTMPAIAYDYFQALDEQLVACQYVRPW